MQSQTSVVADHLAIQQLIVGWGIWRDTCDWPMLRESFAREAVIRTTWFAGRAADFVDASERMAAAGTTSLQHVICTPIVDIRGDHATSICRVILMVRAMLDGIAVDATCHGRFHDRLIRERGQWRLLRREPVYEKDRIDPVRAEDRVNIDVEALNRFPTPYRHLAYLQSRGGASITMDLILPLSPADQALVEGERQWLASADEERHAVADLTRFV